MKQVMLLLLVVAGLSYAATKCYDVVPYRNCIGTQEVGEAGVSQFYRNTLDSLSAVSVWIGDTIDGDFYKVEVRDSVSDSLVADNPGRHATQCWAWLDFPLTKDAEPVRGRTYKVVVTRPSGGAISFAYDTTNKYRYGCLSVGGTAHDSWDLALRIYGLHDAVDSDWWSIVPGCPWDNSGWLGTWRSRMETLGVKRADFSIYWDSIEGSQGDFDFTALGHDIRARQLDSLLECTLDARPQLCPPWASSRVETNGDTSHHCPPRNLFLPVGDSHNYWARFIERTARHYDTVGNPIHTWSAWNEPNDTLNLGSPPTTGWWRRPNMDSTYPAESFPGARGLCSLYVRLCAVTESVIHHSSLTGHTTDKFLIGSTARVRRDAGGWDTIIVPGDTWIWMCYDIATGPNGPGIFWDGVAVHPYQLWYQDLAETYEADARRVHEIMRAFRHSGEVWNQELGWEYSEGAEKQARNLAEAFVVTKGSEALPEGGFDGMMWYTLLGTGGGMDLQQILDSGPGLTPRPAFHAFAQLTHALTGKRLNERVMTGDPAADSLVRMYEFEDPADSSMLWACWRNWPPADGNNSPSPVSVRMPVRSDTMAVVALDYGDNPAPQPQVTGTDGWLQTWIGVRPAFFRESSVTARPDIALDSLRLVPDPPRIGSPLRLQAFVSNHGSRQPANGSPGGLDFRYNGNSLGPPVPWRDTALDQGNFTMYEYMIGSVPHYMRGSALFSAEANPEQSFVELGTDDNAGYHRTDVQWPPTGSADVVAPSGGLTNEPLALLRLSSTSLAADSTGNTPADSARIILKRYSVGSDTLLDSTATAWFPFTSDTCLPFALGEGRYRLFAQYRDSGGVESDVVHDTVDTVVVFDTTAATGSIELNSGARFTNTTVCTLAIEASDNLSGVHAMRIGRAEPVELVRDGGFNTASADWEYSSACLDSGGLGMAVLQVSQDSTAWARQDIPADSVGSLLGDTARLSADLLVQVPDGEGDTCGRLELGYVYEKNSHTLPDSVVNVGSIPFLGGVQALCGQSCLSGAFALPAPWNDTGWTWTAARVELVAGGPQTGTGSGVILLDNVQLSPSGPAPDYSWWTAFDTVRVCTLSTGAGQRSVYAVLQDTCGNETTTPLSEDVILDALAPLAHISSPTNYMTIGGVVNITGWAFDSITVAGDSWFEVRKLQYKATADTQWLPCAPGSCSGVAVFNTFGPGHLGWWNTLGIANDFYHLRLSCSDSAANTTTHQITVKIQNGRFMAKTTGSGPAGGEVSLDAVGSDFVGSATGKVVRLGDELDSLSGFTLTDSGTAAYVAGITELDSTHILVADARSGDITKMTKQGTDKQELIQDLDLPVAVATDQGGNIWTLDRGSSRLYKHSPDGTLLLTLGGEGEDSTHLDSPEALAVKGPLVYVADTRNNRVCVYDTAGALAKLITGEFQMPCAIVVTDSGQLYLVDKTKGTIEGVNELGGHLLTIVQEDSAPLRQLALSDDGACLVTLKTGSNDILKYQVVADDTTGGGVQSGGTGNLPKVFVLHQPSPTPARTRLQITYAIPRASHVTVKLYDIAGKLQRTLRNEVQKPGLYRLTWDRRDQKGRTVAGGVYFCQVENGKERQQKKVVLTE